MHLNHDLIGVTIGVSLTCTPEPDTSRHKSLAPLCYFFGSVIFLTAAFDWLRHDPIESCSGSCLRGYFPLDRREEPDVVAGGNARADRLYRRLHRRTFCAHNLNAPIIVMLTGFILIGLGVVAVKIEQQIIKQEA
jgi:hypothetical protein